MRTIVRTREEILTFLVHVVSTTSGTPAVRVRMDEDLERYGVDSMQWANIAYELSIWAGRQFSPEEAASCQTISGLAEALSRA